jgi:hypothetical protein
MMPPDSDSGQPKRKPIPKRVRFEVLRRDNYTCRYCRSTSNELTIDHVTPVVLGGTDDPANLVAACRDCNGGKSSSTPDAATVAQVSDEHLRWAAAVKSAADRAIAGDAALAASVDGIREYWDACVPGFRQNQPRYRLPSDWRATIESLLAAGLPDVMILDSIDVATSRPNLDQVFRYMIGVANNKLAKLHEDARSSLAEEPATPREDPLVSAYWEGYWACLKEADVALPGLQFAHLSVVADGPNLRRA